MVQALDVPGDAIDSSSVTSMTTMRNELVTAIPVICAIMNVAITR